MLLGRGARAALPAALRAARRRALSAATPAAPLFEDLIVTKSCAKRILALREAKGDEELHLRLAVESGGCSGFQYSFEMEGAGEVDDEEDRLFLRDGATVVVDEASLEFVRGATVDFAQELIRSAFVVVNNPNSESACGCGNSFAMKNFEANPAVD
mmetsp:Transcript_19881/g.60228  ORF Transcript_19881/g.60228 Transcript_19881/m.60228 type:complete len:156 (-) Transcript_19881:58-525(-)